MTGHTPSTPPHVPGPGEHTIPELEDDETIAPRPEEEIADRLRATPDTSDHRTHGTAGETGHSG